MKPFQEEMPFCLFHWVREKVPIYETYSLFETGGNY